jgi:hypothetical protein
VTAVATVTEELGNEEIARLVEPGSTFTVATALVTEPNELLAITE